MKIKLLVTGGTIDKIYNELNGNLEFNNTNVDKILKTARTTLNITTKTLFLKDSLDMNDDDMDLLLSACKDCSEDKIVITHGTDTIVKSAKLLATNINNKTIILCGAMIPYMVDNSDALFNLGAAITAVQLVEKGVYITMNGKIFDCDKVIKNKKLGIFENAN